MCALTDNREDTCDELKAIFDLPRGAGSSKQTYWKLAVPATEVTGTCTNEIMFTAVQST